MVGHHIYGIESLIYWGWKIESTYIMYIFPTLESGITNYIYIHTCVFLVVGRHFQLLIPHVLFVYSQGQKQIDVG